MKKIFLILFFFISSLIYGQDSSLVDVFIKNFEKGNPNVKYQVLLDAADMGIEGMGLLFHRAILYVLDRIELLKIEDILVRIATFSVKQIHAINYTKSVNDLWKLFMGTGNTEIRVNILIALGDIGKNEPDIIEKMNKWLDSQNNIFLTGKRMDQQVIIACVQALGKIGDPSSFTPVFTTMIQQYSALVTSTAEQALDMIKGDLSQLYMNVIMEGRFIDKKQALLISLRSTKLNDQQKCRIAEFALNIALYSSPADPNAKIMSLEIRYLAAEFLGEKGWSNATELMIEHFNQSIFDLDSGRVQKSFLIQAIGGLGNMKTHEAAKRLTLYLEHINSFTENEKVYDEQIVLAVIYALGSLGDRIASAALLYSRYLNYSRTVKKAAQDALRNLK